MGLLEIFTDKVGKRAKDRSRESAFIFDFYSDGEKDIYRRALIRGIEMPEEIRAFTTGTMNFMRDGSLPEMTVRFDAYRNEEKGGWDIRRFTDVPENAASAIAAGIAPGQGDAFMGYASCDFDALWFLSGESAARGFRSKDEGAGHRDMPHWKNVAERTKQPIDAAGIVQPVVKGQVLADNVIFNDPEQIEIRDSTLPPAIVPPAIVPVEEQKQEMVRQASVPVKQDRNYGLTRVFNRLMRVSNIFFPDAKAEALVEAAASGDIEKTQFLLMLGANPDSRIYRYQSTGYERLTIIKTPLTEAIIGKHTKIAQMLIEVGADVELEADGGKEGVLSPLPEAALRGLLEIVDCLIAADADVNTSRCGLRGRALRWAALNRHTDVVRSLIKAGADVHAKNEYQETALILATEEGHTEIAQMLRAAGAKETPKEIQKQPRSFVW
ncbi:MAG: hypothetical protein CO093_04770 [Alphaproteobacteria bacterium CG_4_9_14_3_um_filter_47_13]|nr:MAG: hypothetical protein CO093_04770 [Alphaproteobacteria bacterium CG_4_9_14_3_um_filter_47_13]